MDLLWAPWRNRYITKKEKGPCIFCRAVNCRNKKSRYIVLEGEFSMSMLNVFPYNNGHTLVFPKRHIKTFSQLENKELIDLFKTFEETRATLEEVLKPHGYNIGINISTVAGAGIPGHLHLHLVPRWRGDTNFMPVIYNTKVVPQSLSELYRRLQDAITRKKP